MNLNLNDNVSVVLTEAGAKRYNEWHEQFIVGLPVSRSKGKAAGDTLHAQLWMLFQTFGDSIHLGMSEVPFLDNEITLKEKT